MSQYTKIWFVDLMDPNWHIPTFYSLEPIEGIADKLHTGNTLKPEEFDYRIYTNYGLLTIYLDIESPPIWQITNYLNCENPASFNFEEWKDQQQQAPSLNKELVKSLYSKIKL